MFETFEKQAERPSVFSSVASYFAQLCLAVPLGWIVSAGCSVAFHPFGSGDHGDKGHFLGYEVICCLFAAAVAGRIVGRADPKMRRMGRWIWALPGVFVFPAMLGGWRTLPSDLFASGSTEGGLAAYLFLIPAFSALGYSAGIASSERKLSQDILLGAALVFVVLVITAREVEYQHLDSSTGARVVIDPKGLPFSVDPMAVCEAGNTTLLPHGTHVYALEHRSCGTGRLLDPGEPRRSGEWDVERMRILDGPNKGKEGWVLAYGIPGY
ncbi:MAG TPA: hypothetical protein VMT15_16780 [Bryobacteraceae bacterium]|nr:hypothetical protein [Bryobacteraceae bacterium]